MAGIYADIPEFASQQAAIDRRRKIAEMLQQQSLEPIPNQIPQRGFASDTALPNAIAKIAQAYFGSKAAKEADKQQAEIGADYTAKKDAEIQKVKTAYFPEGSQPIPQANVRGDVMQISRTPEEMANAIPRTVDQRQEAIVSAMMSPYKEVQKTGQILEGVETRKQMADYAEQAKKETAERDARNKKELAAMLIAGRQGVADTNVAGKVSLAGTKEGGKQAEKQKTKDEAREGFAGSLDSLEKAYLELDKLGGITNPDKSSMSNLGAAISSSGLGQVMGGALGTQEQALRKQISGTIPLLVLDIKNLTGASAQQMNSNVELQNFMKAASDPKSDLKSNLILLKNLREKYLGKSAIATAQEGETRTLPDGRVMRKTAAGWIPQ